MYCFFLINLVTLIRLSHRLLLCPDHYSRLKALSTAFRCKVKLTIIPTTCIPFKHFLKTHCQWQYFHSMHNLTSRSLSRYQEHRNWSVNSAAEFPFLLQHFKNYSKGSRNWHVNSAAEIPLSHLVWLPSTFSNYSSTTRELAYNHWSRDPFLPPWMSCTCNFNTAVASSEDLKPGRALDATKNPFCF